MRRVLAGGLATVFALALGAATAYGAEPPNNDIGNAEPISFPWSEPLEVSVDTTLADAEPLELSTCADRSVRTVWYQLDVGTPGRITVDPAGSEFADARLALYRYTGGPTFGGLVAASTCTSGTWGSWNVSAGTTYYLQVADAGSGGGTARLRFIPPPPNDGINGAAIVTETAAVPSTDTRSATAETGEVRSSCAVYPTSRTVWHVFTAKASGSVTIDPTGSTLASPIVTAYRLSGDGGYGGGLSEIACQNTGVAVSVEVTVGETYYVQSSAGATGGGGILDLAFTFPARPPGPVNDDFANAIALPSGQAVNTGSSTLEVFEPRHCLAPTVTRTVWYSYAPTERGRFVVETTGVGDATLALYYADGPVSDLRGLSIGNCWPVRSSSLNARVGRTYYVQVSDTGSGGGTLTMNLTFTPTPSNDDLAAAKVVSAPFTEQVDISGASKQTGETSPCAASFGRSVWYAFTPGADDIITVDPAGSTFADASLTVYRLVGSGFGGLSPIACRTSGSALSIAVKAGVTYLVQASDNGSGGGTLRISIASTPGVPTAPPNDYFGEATVVAGLPFSDSVDIRSATCQPQEYGGCSWGTHSVWYMLPPGEWQGVAIDATGTDFHDGYIKVWWVYSPGVGGLAALTNWDGPYLFSPQPDRTYYIQVTDRGSGGGTLHIELTAVPRPPNDNLADAKLVPVSGLTDTVDTRIATLEPGEPLCCSSPSTRTVWYTYTAEWDGTVRIDATGTAFDDLRLEHYLANGTGFAGLLNISGRVDATGALPLEKGHTYYTQAYDLYQGGGTLRLTFTFSSPPDTVPPVIAFHGNASPYFVDEPVLISVTATDETDGVLLPSCQLIRDLDAAVVSTSCEINEQAWDLGPGGFTFRATATDKAGNVAEAAEIFTVAVDYGSMINLTRAWVSKPKVADDLVAKLEAAARAEARKNLRIEQSILDDYRALLRAQTGKSILEADAQRLTAFSIGL